MALLGVDVGTSGCKAATFGEDGRIISSFGREYPPSLCSAPFLEVDPDLVWSAVADCIRQSAAKCVEKIHALAVSSFGEAAVPIDRSGKALSNGILFADPRGQTQLDFLVNRLGSAPISRRTGLPLHRMYTLLRLMWLRDNKPQIFLATHKYLQFAEFINYRLTGEFVTDYSLAARSMAFNILDKSWDRTILQAASIDTSVWSDALPAGSVIGRLRSGLAADLCLPVDTLVVTGGHDQPCAALGSGVIQNGDAIDGIGTTECITTSFDQPVLDPALFAMNYHCGPHVAPGKYVTFAYTMSAGALLQWFRDTIGRLERDEAAHLGVSAYTLLDGRISREPSGLLVLPHFDGSGTPTLDPDSCGAIVGLSRKTTPDEIYRAMLESITFEMRYNLECLDKTGIHVDKLRAAGGGARSAKWLQIKADILSRPIASLEVGEAGALGAAILAGTAVGVYKSIQEACGQMVRFKDLYEPDQVMTARYDASYLKYLKLYTAVKVIMATSES